MPTNPSVIELSTLDGANGFQINGEAAGDRSGYSVAGAGDVNGDGFADVIIGAKDATSNGPYGGASYVVFGKAGGFASNIELSTLHASAGFRINGEIANDQSGVSVAGAGDVNGDGFADLIVGAYLSDVNGTDSGASYVVFGKASGFSSSLDLSALHGSNGFQINGEVAGDECGWSVSGAGDVNGDGYADLIVGARLASVSGAASGASYVVFGKAGGFASNIELSTLGVSDGFQINGEVAGDRSGWSVSGAGDINGDGFADLIIGAYNAAPNGGKSGASYVVFGKASGFVTNFQLSDLDGSNGFQISGDLAGDESGWSVSSAGDINGDGYADLIIGARAADPNGTSSGAAYVVFGTAGGYASNIQLSALDGPNGFRIDGEAQSDHAGVSVAGGGDVNGDGFADLLVGADDADPNGDYSGASYVVFGKAGGFASAVELSTLDGSNGFQVNGEAAGDHSGVSVASAGDVNDDGFADLVIGAYHASPNGTYSGSSYVVFGERSMVDVLRQGTDIANRINGGRGADTLQGLAGDDTLIGWEDDDRLSGGSGKDTLLGGRGDDTLFGNGGGDHLFAGGGDNRLVGGSGNDQLHGGDGDDRMLGGSGNDTVFASTGHDRIDGGSGTDLLNVGASFTGAVHVNLAAGTASFTGGDSASLSGIENVLGTKAADHIQGDGVANLLTGGKGNDTLDGASGDDNLFGDDGKDSLNGGNGKDALHGGGGADKLIGGGGNDNLRGDAGKDMLVGGNGDDALTGGAGSDVLNGGLGRDVLRGGSGADSFDFNKVTESKAGSLRDRIADFSKADDLIDLSDIDARTGAGNQAFHFIGSAAFSGAKGDLRAVNSGANAIVSGDVDGDKHADFAIVVESVNNLHAGDFIL